MFWRNLFNCFVILLQDYWRRNWPILKKICEWVGLWLRTNWMHFCLWLRRNWMQFEGDWDSHLELLSSSSFIASIHITCTVISKRLCFYNDAINPHHTKPSWTYIIVPMLLSACHCKLLNICQSSKNIDCNI